MLYHGEMTLPYGYGDAEKTKLTSEQTTGLIQTGITGTSEIAAALISVFGAQALAKQQQQYATTQQRMTYAQELALAKLGMTPQGAGMPVAAPAPAAAPNYTPLFLLAGLGIVAMLMLRKDK